MKSLTALILAGSLLAVPALAIENQTQTTAKTQTTVTKTTVHPKKHHKKHVTKHVKTKKTQVRVTHEHHETTNY